MLNQTQGVMPPLSSAAGEAEDCRLDESLPPDLGKKRPLWVNALLTTAIAGMLAMAVIFWTVSYVFKQSFADQIIHESQGAMAVLEVASYYATVKGDKKILEAVTEALLEATPEISSIEVTFHDKHILKRGKGGRESGDAGLVTQRDLMSYGLPVGVGTIRWNPGALDQLHAKSVGELEGLVIALMVVLGGLITAMFYRLAVKPVNGIYSALATRSRTTLRELVNSPSREVSKIAFAVKRLLRAQDALEAAGQEDKVVGAMLSMSTPEQTVSEYLEAALHEVLEHVPWLGGKEKRGAIFLADERENLTLVAAANLGSVISTSCSRVAKGHCLCGKAVDSASILFADHVDERFDTRLENIEDHGQYSVPISKNGKVLGLLLVYVPLGHEASDREMSFLQRASAALALAIEQKHYEEELRSTSHQLHEANEQVEASHRQVMQAEKLSSIGQLAAGIAHEINTPVQFVGDNTRFLDEAFTDLSELIDGYEEILKVANTKDVSKELIDKVREISEEIELDYLVEEIPSAISQSIEGVERISTIVQSMKEFSHPGCVDMAPCDINKGISSTINVSRNEWKYCATLSTEFEQNLPLVPCFAGELNQVILNIIVNAAHAIGDRVDSDKGELGNIHITTRVRDEHVEISIKDTGGGVPEAIRTKVFDPFFTTKEVGKGTGQGLAIAHSVITQKHKGKLHLEVEEGVGTTFVISLPLAQEVAQSTHVQIELEPETETA